MWLTLDAFTLPVPALTPHVNHQTNSFGLSGGWWCVSRFSSATAAELCTPLTAPHPHLSIVSLVRPPSPPPAPAALCSGCEGFNSNGWLKQCLPPRCPDGQGGMEPTAPCNLYTKIGPPKPPPPPTPPVPIPDVEDV